MNLNKLFVGLLIIGYMIYPLSIFAEEAKPPKVEEIPAPVKEDYEFVETFGSPDINTNHWKIIQTDNSLTEVKIVDGKLYCTSRGKNNHAGIETTKNFRSKEFTLEFDMYCISEQGICFTAVSFPVHGSPDYWAVALLRKAEALQIFTLYQGEGKYWGGPAPLSPDRWYHFIITNKPDNVTFKVIDLKEKAEVCDMTVEHDTVDPFQPIKFVAVTGEDKDSKESVLVQGVYFDNICWK